MFSTFISPTLNTTNLEGGSKDKLDTIHNEAPEIEKSRHLSQVPEIST